MKNGCKEKLLLNHKIFSSIIKLIHLLFCFENNIYSQSRIGKCLGYLFEKLLLKSLYGKILFVKLIVIFIND